MQRLQILYPIMTGMMKHLGDKNFHKMFIAEGLYDNIYLFQNYRAQCYQQSLLSGNHILHPDGLDGCNRG